MIINVLTKFIFTFFIDIQLFILFLNEVLNKLWPIIKKMTSIPIKVLKSKNGKFIFFLLFVTFGGIYLYFDRPTVDNEGDVIEINGTLKYIAKELVYSNKINKTERDSTYHISLNEYPSKFQVSYSPFDRKKFYSTSQIGDKIQLHIARQDEKFLNIKDKRIRSFSLTVNDKTYLSLKDGLSGFGKGLFELGMIFIPLIILTILILRTLQKK